MLDNLKEMLNKRKAQSIGGNWVKCDVNNKIKKDIYDKDKEEIEKQREERLLKKLKHFQDFYSTKTVDTSKIERKREHAEPDQPNSPGANSPLKDEQIEQSPPPMEKPEVVQRLRELGEPVTYFGESDWQRFRRLYQIEQAQQQKRDKDDSDDDEPLPKGDPDQEKKVEKDFHIYMPKMSEQELKQKIQEQEDDIQNFLNKLNKQVDPIYNPDKPYQHRQVREFEQELVKDGTYDQKCDDVYDWCKNLLKQWELKLMDKYDNETKKRSLDGSKAINTYTQSVEYIKPLSEMLKKRKINIEILNSLYCIVRYCVYREYVKAHDKYLELAIGNAPWPMGVTMVGIHERTGRAKIFSSQIAHILNDETQRKYIQSIKRLITFSQKFYPNDDPSKMVDFSSEVTL